MSTQDRAQHTYFSDKLVPELFFENPDGLIDMLENSGERYLEFLWQRAAETTDTIDPSQQTGPEGRVFEYKQGYRVGVITMPLPEAAKETKYLGLITRKSRLHFRGVERHKPRLVLLTLESRISGQDVWAYVELTPEGEPQRSPGPESPPRPEDYFANVKNLVE